MRKFFIFLMLTHVFLSPFVLADTMLHPELVTKLTTINDAKAIVRIPPKYPINEAKSGRDGWVVMSYVIEPNGSTSNILIEDSSGSRGFEREALKALKKWSYQPASENGENIQQCKNTVQLDFKMKRKQSGVTKKFYRLYNHFNEALKQNNQEDIANYYPKIKTFKLNTHLESYYKFSILAEYEKNKKNKTAQLNYLNKALRFSESYSYFNKLRNDEDVIAAAIKMKNGQKHEAIQVESLSKTDKINEQNFYLNYHSKLLLELDLNKVSAALNSIDHLLLLTVNKKQHPSYQKQKQLIEQLIQSPKPIATVGNIGEKTFWQHSLLRDQFSFIDIKGKLTKIDLRCSNKRHLYTINDKSTWTIPQNWQGCSVYIYGEDNASFTLVETHNIISKKELALNQ
ncbi:MAG: TonB family protein [Alteromonadaceae bacterium]|jgi:TonB family protein